MQNYLNMHQYVWKKCLFTFLSQTIKEITTLAQVERKCCKKKSSKTILKYIMWPSHKYANINTTLIYLMTGVKTFSPLYPSHHILNNLAKCIFMNYKHYFSNASSFFVLWSILARLTKFINRFIHKTLFLYTCI